VPRAHHRRRAAMPGAGAPPTRAAAAARQQRAPRAGRRVGFHDAVEAVGERARHLGDHQLGGQPGDSGKSVAAPQ
jgi:hypothetical protein